MTWDEMICNHELDGAENHIKSMIGLYHVSTCEDFIPIVLSLREHVEFGPQQLFCLVEVGLSNFQILLLP